MPNRPPRIKTPPSAPGGHLERAEAEAVALGLVLVCLKQISQQLGSLLSRAAWKTSDFVVWCQNLQQIIVFLAAPRQTHGQKPHLGNVWNTTLMFVVLKMIKIAVISIISSLLPLSFTFLISV